MPFKYQHFFGIYQRYSKFETRRVYGSLWLHISWARPCSKVLPDSAQGTEVLRISLVRWSNPGR
jgi:hypothetical protein